MYTHTTTEHTTVAPIDSNEHRDRNLDRAELTHRLLCRAAVAGPDESRRLQDEAILVNTGLAESIARRYAGRAEERSDLVQVAYVGLINAVRRFSPEKGIDFVSFALPTITGEIKRFFRDQGWTVRPPRRVQDLHRRLATGTEQLSQLLGRTPSPEELADYLDEDPSDVNEALSCRSCYTPMSIDAPTRSEEGTATLADLLGEDDNNFGRSEAKTALKPLCESLSERDRRILYLRFVREWTQQEIAEVLGVTQMQVSRLLARILGDLRERLGTLDADEQDQSSRPQMPNLRRRTR
jgi:RNA polymerase sigma-B factor